MNRRVVGSAPSTEQLVAQEHAATAMAVVATEALTRGIAHLRATRGRVIVTPAEREWHWLPAAIIDCTLRAEGWQTTPLGPATSPLRLSQYLQDLGPEATTRHAANVRRSCAGRRRRHRSAGRAAQHRHREGPRPTRRFGSGRPRRLLPRTAAAHPACRSGPACDREQSQSLWARPSRYSITSCSTASQTTSGEAPPYARSRSCSRPIPYWPQAPHASSIPSVNISNVSPASRRTVVVA